MKIFILLLCCTMAFAIESEENENPVVDSAAGSFCGTMMKSQSGRDIYAFLGIRYAEAPTGENRFKQAIPVECFDETYDATEDGPICPQPNSGSHEMSEDCLRLSVYTTALPDESSEPNRPVLVLLHPGTMSTPTGTLSKLGPQIVLDQDMVFVSISYRVGALGFLSTGDERAPGNVGLKDQVLALRWIQENIAAFGGHPKSVVLYGHGTSAMAASLHIVSPMSKGLFQRAMLPNGAATTQKSLPNNQMDLAKKQAELLGCPTDNLDKMFDCLYEKPAQDFVDSYGKLTTLSEYPIQVWTPVIEQTENDDDDDCDDDNDVEPFLTGQPEDLIRSGNANFVPLLIGVNTDGYGYLVIPAEEQAQCGNTTLYDELNKNWEELAPQYFGYESGTSRSCEISKELKSFYLHDEPLKAGSYSELANLYADSLSIFQVHRFQELMTAHSTEPVFIYLYNYPNSDTVAKWSNGTRFGIVHHDEITLAYNVEGRAEHCDNDIEVADQIWGFVSNFAAHSHPTPEHLTKEFPVKWAPSTKDKPQYFHYTGDDDMEMISGSFHQERMDKWNELFPIASNNSTECDD